MHRELIMLVLFLNVFSTIVLAKAKNDIGLQIVTTFKPDDCSYSARAGDTVKVHYTGRLQQTGIVFDSSVLAERDPIEFTLGAGRVIPGWEQGIQGMCVGEKRHLVIPPELAYGKTGHPPTIPGNSVLTFDTELVELVPKAQSVVEFEVLWNAVWFWTIPLASVYVMYRLYSKYQQETVATKKGKVTHKPSHRKK